MRDYDLYVRPNGAAYITKGFRYYKRLQIRANFSNNYGFFTRSDIQVSGTWSSTILEEEKNLMYVPFEMFLAGDKE